MSSGVEGKWAQMQEDRERLREENRILAGKVETLSAQVTELEGASPEGLAVAIAERNVLRGRVVELQREGAEAVVAPDGEEQAVFDHLMAVMDQLKTWGLIANRGEVVAAVHVLQGFVIQHMLQRISGEAQQWGKWFDPEADQE